MNQVVTALVIILSLGFLTLLILAIILVSMMLSVMRNLKRVTERAEEVTSNAADLTAMISRKVAPLAVSAAMAAIARRFKGKKE